MHEQFAAASDATASVCNSLGELHDPRAELALLRMSANASRVVHLLRAAGPDLDEQALEEFDQRQRQALGAVVPTPLSDRAWAQAQGGASEGGLGLRSAHELRLPAFIASRTEARSLAATMVDSLPASLRDTVFAHWDATTAAAIAEWSAELPPDAATAPRSGAINT